jgi:hypothetical protein
MMKVPCPHNPLLMVAWESPSDNFPTNLVRYILIAIDTTSSGKRIMYGNKRKKKNSLLKLPTKE